MEHMFEFKSSKEDMDRLSKAYIREVLYPGESHSIQNHFAMEGFFSVKISPLGPNFCLLEDLKEGIIEELICDSIGWWKQWFRCIRPLQKTDVDSEKVMWIKIFGVPCQAWSMKFSISLANKLGKFIWDDENTSQGKNFEVARIMIRVPLNFYLLEAINVLINEESVRLVLREDPFGPPLISSNHHKPPGCNGFDSLATSEESWSAADESSVGDVSADNYWEHKQKDEKFNENFGKKDRNESHLP